MDYGCFWTNSQTTRFRTGRIFLVPCWEDLIHPCGSHAKPRREQVEHLHRGDSHSEAVPQKMEGEQFEENIYTISKELTWNMQDHLK